MARTTTPQVVTSYLNELDAALTGVADDVRSEIVAGVREELQGMDAAAAALRIEELGDPQFIAAEARAGGPATAPAPVAAAAVAPAEPTWYPVLASLLIMFGGLIVPAIGYIAGFVMMWTSRSWRLMEKWVATLTPVAAVLAIALVVTITRMQPTEDTRVGAGDFQAPQIEHFMPTSFDILWSAVPLVIGVQVVVGAWLLWRAKRRWATGG